MAWHHTDRPFHRGGNFGLSARPSYAPSGHRGPHLRRAFREAGRWPVARSIDRLRYGCPLNLWICLRMESERRRFVSPRLHCLISGHGVLGPVQRDCFFPIRNRMRSSFQDVNDFAPGFSPAGSTAGSDTWDTRALVLLLRAIRGVSGRYGAGGSTCCLSSGKWC
jgi:hypothetical protein